MIIDIVYIIALIIGPILVLMVAITQRWQWSLVPTISFAVFWVAWYLLNTTVPFDLLDKVWWFIIAIGVLVGAEIIGLLIRWDATKKCNPEMRVCDPF